MTTDNPQNESSAGTEAKKAGREFRDAAQDEARGLRDAAEERLQERAEGTRDVVADEVGSVGRALRKASEELRSGSVSEQAFASAAEALADVSDRMHGRDLGQMLNEVSEFGRRNPATLLGGAALLGFAGMRLAKASHRDRADGTDRDTPSNAKFAPGSTHDARAETNVASTARPNPAAGPTNVSAPRVNTGRTDP